MPQQNIKVTQSQREEIDRIRGNKPRNAVVQDALDALKGTLDMDVYLKQRVGRILREIENNVIVPLDKQSKVKRELEELRRIIS